MVHVVSRPEVLTEHPSQDELWETTVFKGTIAKYSGSPLFREVAIFEHGRMGIVVSDTTWLSLKSSGSTAHLRNDSSMVTGTIVTYLLSKDIL